MNTLALVRYPSGNNIVSYIPYIILAFIGSQRVYIAGIYENICVVFFILSVINQNTNRSKSITFLIFSLFLSVDNGGGVYNETSAFIRYLIYFYAVYIITKGNIQNIKKSRITPLVIFICCVLLTTILYSGEVSQETLRRDIILLFISGIIFLKPSSNYDRYKFNYTLLSLLILFYLLGETINSLTYDYTSDYMNYDTTKSLITFPLLLAITRQESRIKIIFLFTLSMSILLMYVTRMIIVSLLASILLFYLCQIFKNKESLAKIIIGSLISIVITIMVFPSFDNIEQYKLFGTIISALNNSSSSSSSLIIFLQSLDEVRYYESLMFFEKNIFSIFLGSGLGSGIFDINNYLSFVGYYQSAFTREELISGIFYNFHDVWVDIGLRFGLLYLFFIYYLPVRYIFANTCKNKASALQLLILITCAFFSYSGVLIAALFYLDFLRQNQGVNKKTVCSKK
ncbi:hypothetical protein ACWJJH_00005 [Endozoicomonadaceae bacterium StTr2]